MHASRIHIFRGHNVSAFTAQSRLNYRQWVRTAKFVSLNSQIPAEEPLTNGPQLQELKSFQGQSKVRLRSSGNRRTSRNALGDDPGNLLEALFDRNQDSQVVGRDGPAVPNAEQLMIYEHIHALNDLLANDAKSTTDAWDYFITNLGPAAWSNLSSEPSSFHITANKLFDKLLEVRSRDDLISKLPLASDITSAFAKLGRLTPGQWNAMLRTSLKALSKQIDGGKQDTEMEESLVDDILNTWRVGYNLRASRVSTINISKGEGSSAWNCLPALNLRSALHAKNAGGIAKVLGMMLPEYVHHKIRSLPSTALATFVLIIQCPKFKREKFLGDFAFIELIAGLLYSVRCTSTELGQLLKSGRETIIDTKVFEMDKVVEAAKSIALTENKAVGSSAPNPATHIRRAGQFANAFFEHRLSRAVAGKDLKVMDDLWAQFAQGKPPNSSSTEKLENEHFSLSREICDRFILDFMRLRQPDRAIDVWNHMIKVSIEPTLATWNAMLEGCKDTKDTQSLEDIWSKLGASGLQPDMVCWTTRISALMDAGQLSLAIQALEEMGAIWKNAARRHRSADLETLGDIDGVVKPTIETINAAVAGLLRRRKTSAAQQVLKWGGRLGIKPDIFTFNILLRPLVREQRHEEVKRLLRHMTEQSIRPDVATFTIILSETFSATDGLPPQDQLKIVEDVFADMDAIGVKPNDRAYAAIIFSMLQSQSHHVQAVNTLLARMTAQGLEPSAYIFTMLVDHYFRQEHPDLEAVRNIIERIRISKSAADHILWDRIIVGYALIGDTSNALNILGRVDREGCRVTWTTLSAVVQALIDNDERELAEEVIANIKLDRGGPAAISEPRISAQQRFWDTAAEFGLA